MTKEDQFYLDEYKKLTEEMATKLKERLDFNRWGLISLAVLYAYIFSNPAKPMLFWVPVFLSAAMVFHLNEEHRMVAKAGRYIKEETEPWIRGQKAAPKGWETFLKSTPKDPPWWSLKRWPSEIWEWSPVPMWCVLFGVTFFVAILAIQPWWPWLSGPFVSTPIVKPAP
jgi:hypothetical protein